MQKINVGIFGGSGYMGGELLRLLFSHPNVNIKWVTSRKAKFLNEIHPNFVDKNMELSDPEANLEHCDIVFFATPGGIASSKSPEFLKNGAKIIDLGSDFRLKNKEDWERLYGQKHPNWNLVEEAVYGIPELNREVIKNSRVIANPGCFSSAAILGLAPLFSSNISFDRDNVSITGISGTAGMGMEVTKESHHPEITNNVLAYNMIDHRHSYEIEEVLSGLSGDKLKAHFSPVYVPISRGISSISSLYYDGEISQDDLNKVYEEFYKNEEFVEFHLKESKENKSWNVEPYPNLSTTSATNMCKLTAKVDSKRKRIMVYSVLDSVGKGGAHVAVQNMNLISNIPENTGLTKIGIHPY
jgi:N-acetyl-gamma-glutamyl-phosphate reductase